LVTGSSRGIGRAAAIALAKDGANVAVNYRATEMLAADTEKEIKALGRQAVSIRADVGVSGDVERLVARVRETLGPIDILVNNAGIIRPQPVEEIRESDWDDLITINLKSCFLLT